MRKLLQFLMLSVGFAILFIVDWRIWIAMVLIFISSARYLDESFEEINNE